MKILLSALACEPGKGSELEVGFRALLAAASRHDVWVLTNSASLPALREVFAGHPAAGRVHLEGLPFEVTDQLYPQLTAPAFHRYYDRWQRRAAVRARELEEHIDFDVVHHVTLAASWTRAGVTVIDKPLVWGPVGGGVESPISLASELGWRGLLEDLGRAATRRLLARVGPARRTRERAAVILAQNRATARVLRAGRRLRVLSNATSVDLRENVESGPRRADIVFAARLLPWKGGRLAVRALRYVRHPDAVLRIFGEGPERARMVRAVKQWGLEDKVRFEGRVRRDELLRLVATAGTFLHPAFHDEAGLAVAEALSLGTPVVCLDWGGPAELVRHWDGATAAAVTPQSPEATARALAAAIDTFLAAPPPVLREPRRPSVSFEAELLAAYETARLGGRDVVAGGDVWGFPAGKPQVFADTPRQLSQGVMVYGFGRRMPRQVQAALAVQVRLPGLRRLLAEPMARPTPVCGWRIWHDVRGEVRRRNPDLPLEWIDFQSQWSKQRSSMLGLDLAGLPRLFVVVEPQQISELQVHVSSTASFKVAQCAYTFTIEGWAARQYEPLPRFHRPARWDPARIAAVAADAARALEGLLPRPAETPAHWRPMHGDFVPWNLREDDRGQFWLLDWEDVRWGPPLADLARYVVAYYSLGRNSPARIAALTRRALGSAATAEALREVAVFWCAHNNLQLGDGLSPLSRRKARDTQRASREVAAFRLLAPGALPVRAAGGADRPVR